MSKIGIVGCRYFNDYDKFKEIIESCNVKFEKIISGGATGVDSLVERYAKEYSIPIVVYYPEWNKYGKKAGPLRNQKIIDISDILIALPSKSSIGTWNSISLAKKKNMKVHIINI